MRRISTETQHFAAAAQETAGTSSQLSELAGELRASLASIGSTATKRRSLPLAALEYADATTEEAVQSSRPGVRTRSTRFAKSATKPPAKPEIQVDRNG